MNITYRIATILSLIGVVLSVLTGNWPATGGWLFAALLAFLHVLETAVNRYEL